MSSSDPRTPDEETDERVPDVPADAVDEAERLTRLARAAERRVDDVEGDSGADTDSAFDVDSALEEASTYRERRDELVAAHDYETRLRETDDTLVLYPAEWLEDGVVQVDQIEETERAVEISLSGPGDPEHWREVAEHNDDLVVAVVDDAPDHETNARALAAFASNHYAKPVEELTAEEVREFLEEYYPRNAWPSEADASLVKLSVRKMFTAADTEPPRGLEE